MEKSLLLFTSNIKTENQQVSMWKLLPQRLAIEFENEINFLKSVQLHPSEHLINRILSNIQNENPNFVKK